MNLSMIASSWSMSEAMLRRASSSDTLISASGLFETTAEDIESVLVDNDPRTFAFSRSPGAYVELGFTDNTVVNGPGPDLALFELGFPNSLEVSLTIGGITQEYLAIDTGFDAAGFNLNVALVDLDDFGLGPNEFINRAVIGLSLISEEFVPSLAVVAALNNGPSGEPIPQLPDAGSTLALLGLSASFLGLSNRYWRARS